MKIPRTIEELGDIAGKKVLVRLDLNVPIKDGKVFDDFRILKSLPTVSYLKERGAKLILISHIGEDPGETLAPVAEYLGIKLLPADPKKSEVKDGINNLKNGEAVLLENLRQNVGEILNDQGFAKDLADLADIYVDDAFAVMHRNHASIISLPKLLPSYIGFLVTDEIKNLSQAFNPAHPFLFIIGGAKFSTKIGLVKKFIDIADKIFVGGALSNTVFKYLGLPVGISLVESKTLDLNFIKDNPKIILPTDVNAVSNGVPTTKKPSEVLPSDNMLDIGPETLAILEEEISKAKFILWNGPIGNYEKGFSGMTEELARLVAQSDATSIVGGGDTIASIKNLNLLDKFTFVSSGGGAMLDFLANGTLPGIESLR
ncbi:MAG: phosphoglycerate kinase [Patescibacteria group bacterium]